MKHIYIAVPTNDLCYIRWPKGAKYGNDVMAVVWGISKVEFIRNNHPLGDLYRITATDEDLTALRLRSSVGTIVADIDVCLRK